MFNLGVMLILFALLGLSETVNIVEEKAHRVGGWGGSCTCPDGSVYQVGDNVDGCGSLACIGGVSGTCNRRHGAWSRRKVTCGQPVSVLPMKEGEWHSENFVSEETGETGRLRRFKGVFQDGGHFTLSNIAILEFDSEADTMLFGKITLFPDFPSMFQKKFNFIMDCEGNHCEQMIPFQQTVDACDIYTMAAAANGQVGTTEKLIGAGLKPFLGSGFGATAAKFVYYALQTKNFLEKKADTDVGGGCEDSANMAVAFLKKVTSGESERLFDLGNVVDGLIDLLDNSLGQLTFGVDINIRGKVLNERQMATTSPFDISVDNLHVIIDNGDQCTGNIVCAVLVALGEAFPGEKHDKSVLGCTKFEFVFRLDREDWQNENGVDYTCLAHNNFTSIEQNILNRAQYFWNSIKNAPGIKDFGKHNHLCFHDNHCKQGGDVCIAGLCNKKRGHGGKCLRDADCATGDCMLFHCTSRFNGAMCNTDDDCDSGRCNLSELKCRDKLKWHETCAKDSDCRDGDCLFFKCIDGRDGDLCNTDDDCNSGRCSLFKCKARGRKGDWCAVDNSCKSRDCSWLFKCN